MPLFRRKKDDEKKKLFSIPAKKVRKAPSLRQNLLEVVSARGYEGKICMSLIDTILRQISPHRNFYVDRGRDSKHSGLIAIGGQGILIKCKEKFLSGRNIALKIAIPSVTPITSNRSANIFGPGGPKDKSFARNEISIPDQRFLAGTNLQNLVEKTLQVDQANFYVPQVFFIDTLNAPHVAMEWINSVEILTWIRDKNNLRFTLQLFLKVLEAAEYLHRKMIVFRDWKISNLMMHPLREDDITIIDWGFARKVENHNRSITLTGCPLGSMPYASPKMVDGYARDATQLDDIHQLGYLLWEFVTCRICPPLANFRDEREREEYRITCSEMLPSGISNIFLRATEVYEDDRYNTVEEFKKDCEDAFELVEDVANEEDTIIVNSRPEYSNADILEYLSQLGLEECRRCPTPCKAKFCRAIDRKIDERLILWREHGFL